MSTVTHAFDHLGRSSESTEASGNHDLRVFRLRPVAGWTPAMPPEAPDDEIVRAVEIVLRTVVALAESDVRAHFTAWAETALGGDSAPVTHLSIMRRAKAENRAAPSKIVCNCRAIVDIAERLSMDARAALFFAIAAAPTMTVVPKKQVTYIVLGEYTLLAIAEEPPPLAHIVDADHEHSFHAQWEDDPAWHLVRRIPVSFDLDDASTLHWTMIGDLIAHSVPFTNLPLSILLPVETFVTNAGSLPRDYLVHLRDDDEAVRFLRHAPDMPVREARVCVEDTVSDMMVSELWRSGHAFVFHPPSATPRPPRLGVRTIDGATAIVLPGSGFPVETRVDLAVERMRLTVSATVDFSGISPLAGALTLGLSRCTMGGSACLSPRFPD